MTDLDLVTFAGIAAATTALVGALKASMPVVIAGREAILSLVIAPALAVASKLSGIGFADQPWLAVGIAGILAGAGAQVIHDKVVNPAKGKGAS